MKALVFPTVTKLDASRLSCKLLSVVENNYESIKDMVTTQYFLKGNIS